MIDNDSFLAVPLLGSPGRWLALAIVAAGFLGLLAPAATAQGYRARITQVDRDHFPRVTVYVTITDDQGRPVSTPLVGELAIHEGGECVHRASLSLGPKNPAAAPVDVSVVLVLD